MITINKKAFQNLSWKLITIVIVAIAATAWYFQLSALNVLLLTLASPFLLWLVLQLFVPWFQKLLKTFAKQQDDVALQRYKAARSGLKKHWFHKKHCVWAFSDKRANEIFKNKILPALEKHPKTAFEYISPAHNNLNGQYIFTKTPKNDR